MKTLLVKPHKEPMELEIPNELELMQQFVGGYIQAIPVQGEKNIVIVCNEEGKIQGLPFCRPLYVPAEIPGYKQLVDVICGNFLVMGTKGEDFCGLTQEQADRMKKHFAMIEKF